MKYLLAFALSTFFVSTTKAGVIDRSKPYKLSQGYMLTVTVKEIMQLKEKSKPNVTLTVVSPTLGHSFSKLMIAADGKASLKAKTLRIPAEYMEDEYNAVQRGLTRNQQAGYNFYITEPKYIIDFRYISTGNLKVNGVGVVDSLINNEYLLTLPGIGKIVQAIVNNNGRPVKAGLGMQNGNYLKLEFGIERFHRQ